MTKPISPDALDGWKPPIPAGVFEVFNKLIVDNWDGREATISQDEARDAVAKALNISTEEVFKKKYLDVEKHYRAEGWEVLFDKPGYCENYNAYWKFTK